MSVLVFFPRIESVSVSQQLILNNNDLVVGQMPLPWVFHGCFFLGGLFSAQLTCSAASATTSPAWVKAKEMVHRAEINTG